MFFSFFQLISQRVYNPALGGLGSLPGPQFFAQLIPALIGLAFVVGVFAFVFYFLFGAVSWILAGGDKVAIEVARSRVTHAVIGLFVLFLTFAVLNVFECFFGIGLRNVAVGPFNISFVGTYFCPSTGGPPPPPPTPTATPTTVPPTATVTPMPTLPPSSYYVAFVSNSNPANGNIGSLATANSICQSNATAAGLSGTFRAWLSTDSVNARTNIAPSNPSLPYRLPDGVTQIAANFTDLTDGTINVPINRYANNTTVVFNPDSNVRTGTTATGFNIPGANCANWTSGSTSQVSSIGNTSSTNSLWSNVVNINCSFSMNFYCFQISPLPPATPTPTPISGYWIMTAVPVCSNGATPTILTKSYYALWPPNPLVWVENSPSYTTGSHTQGIPFNPSGSAWFGLENQDSTIIPGSNNNWLQPIGTVPTGMTFGIQFVPQTWMVRISNTTPSGSYTINFSVPNTYCPIATSTPTPTPISQPGFIQVLLGNGTTDICPVLDDPSRTSEPCAISGTCTNCGVTAVQTPIGTCNSSTTVYSNITCLAPPATTTPTPPPSIIVANEASLQTCNQVCSLSGLSCFRIGTNATANNNTYRRGAGGNCSDTIADCNQVMVPSVMSDPGNPTRACDWTLCQCR